MANLLAPWLLLLALPASAMEPTLAAEAGLKLAEDVVALCQQKSPTALGECVAKEMTPAEIAGVEAAAQAQRRQLYADYSVKFAERLLRSEQPRALLLAARLLRSTVDYRLDGPQQNPEAVALRQRSAELARAAALRAGDDIMVLWPLANGAFHEQAPELQATAIAALRRLTPRNLAVWALDDGNQAWDFDRLNRAAGSELNDIAYLERVRNDVALLEGFPVPDALRADAGEWLQINDRQLSDRELLSMLPFGIAMAEAIPAWQHLTYACKPDNAAWSPRHRTPCERIADVLVNHSDTLIGVHIGFAMRRELAPTPADRRVAENAKRTFDYQREVAMEWQQKSEDEGQHLERLLAPGATEMGLIREDFAASGAPLEPPANWRSPQQRYADEQRAEQAVSGTSAQAD